MDTSPPWLPRLLFRAAMSAAGLLVGLVLFAPLLSLDPAHSFTTKLWHLFANDGTLRQVAVISALGLWITAVVCFRGQPSESELRTQVTQRPE